MYSYGCKVFFFLLLLFFFQIIVRTHTHRETDIFVVATKKNAKV